MNKEFIQSQFDQCDGERLVTYVAGILVGRAIEQWRYNELEPFIQQCRWSAIDRIKKMQQEASYEL